MLIRKTSTTGPTLTCGFHVKHVLNSRPTCTAGYLSVRKAHVSLIYDCLNLGLAYVEIKLCLSNLEQYHETQKVQISERGLSHVESSLRPWTELCPIARE